MSSVYKLPKRKSIPCEDMWRFFWLFYGERKIGKTILASHFPDPFFLFFEPGGRSLSLLNEYVPSWDFFKRKILKRLIEEKTNYCKTIVWDTGFMAYERVFWYIMEQLNINGPQDEEWGNAWKCIDREFRDVNDMLQELGFGIVIIAHSELVTIKKKGQLDYTKIRTELGKQAFRYYNGQADFIGYYEYDEDDNRIMTIRGDASTEAGVRMTKKFLYTDGTPIKTLKMEGDLEGLFAFNQLKDAFNNLIVKEGGGRSTQKNKKVENRKKKHVYTR